MFRHCRSALLIAALLTAACGPKPTPKTPPPQAQSYDELVRSARSAAQGGRPERSAELAERAAALAPNDPQALAIWGLALLNLEKLGEAIAKLEEARRLGSDDRQAYVGLSSAYDVTGQYAKAVEVDREWLGRHSEDSDMRRELGMSLLAIDQAAAGVLELRRAAQDAPTNLEVRQDLGYALFVQGDLEGAETELLAVLAQEHEKADATRLLATVRAARGNSAAALQLLDALLKKNPDDREARHARARVRLTAGDASSAILDYQIVLKLEPENAIALLGAAEALIVTHRLDEAARVVAQSRKVLGDRPEVRFREAQLGWRQGDHAALTRLQALAEARPTDPTLWRELELAAQKLGDQALADKARRVLRAIERPAKLK